MMQNNDAAQNTINSNNIRIQIQPQAAQNIRMNAPQTVQMVSSPIVGGAIGASPRISSQGQPMTLIPGPRGTGGLQRVLIRPQHPGQPQQFVGVRPIAPAPRPSSFPQGAPHTTSTIIRPQHIIPGSNQLPPTIQARPMVPSTAPRLPPVASVDPPGQNRSAIASKLKFNAVDGPMGPQPKLKHADLLDRSRIQDLVNEVDPNQQLDEDVQNLLLEIADDFIEKTITTSCQIAQHRNASTLETSDVQLCLERNYNMWIPGFSESNPDDTTSGVSNLFTKGANVSSRKNMGNEAHKQRMSVLRKTMKK
ncbi:uncharacterized protein LOC134854647 [Symsagittifera roscoffensis]|uniref:uncharacterized protein LOC134854647 n=1 Tax=Symsagittifera roscoffensis TaxID=84072 RepID=UPI00307C7143